METLNRNIRILVHELDNVFREGLVQTIRAENGFEIVSISENESLTSLVEGKLPDVVITSLQLEETDITEAIRTISVKFPQISVLVISTFEHDIIITRMLQAGVKGCLLQNVRKPELIKAIKALYRSDQYYTQRIARRLANVIARDELPKYALPRTAHFTDNEKSFIQLLCQGYSMKEISAMTGRTIRTLERKKEILFGKAEKRNIAGLIIYAIVNGLFDPYTSVG